MIDYERAVPDLERPREKAKPIRCWNCGNTLGAAAPSGVVVIRHKGREVVARMPLGIVCEECGERNVLSTALA